MASNAAVGKRAKISQAQQYLILTVLGTSMLLGAALALVAHFNEQIAFNSKVIEKEDESIKKYSDFIKGFGICKSPSGSVYTDEELSKCDPNLIDAAAIPGTLRYNIIEGMASNAALSSVKNELETGCDNPYTGKRYTYKELKTNYDDANTSEKRIAASELMQKCSALRVIANALPKDKNEEALLASVNYIFDLSGWRFESLSPRGNSESVSFGTNLNSLSVSLSVEADTATTVRVLDNLERSIREFNITRATIGWKNNNSLTIQGQASAFYMTPIKISDSTTTIKAGDTKK